MPTAAAVMVPALITADTLAVLAATASSPIATAMDGGASWTRLKTGMYDLDVRDMMIAATRPKRLFVSAARDMFVSDDLGDT